MEQSWKIYNLSKWRYKELYKNFCKYFGVKHKAINSTVKNISSSMHGLEELQTLIHAWHQISLKNGYLKIKMK